MVHPRTKQPVQPAFLDGKILPEDKRTDLRMELAKWMTSHPFFAEATVNRMWGYFFGRGIVDPVDDFRSLTRQLIRNCSRHWQTISFPISTI
jgi:hypothetical protein